MPSLHIAVGLFGLGITRNLQEALGRVSLFSHLFRRSQRDSNITPLRKAEILIQNHQFTHVSLVSLLLNWAQELTESVSGGFAICRCLWVQILKWYDLMIQWMRFLISLLCSTSHLPRTGQEWVVSFLNPMHRMNESRHYGQVIHSKRFHSAKVFPLETLGQWANLLHSMPAESAHVDLRSFCREAISSCFVGKAWAGQCQSRQPDCTGGWYHGIKNWTILFVCESEKMWNLVHDAYFRFRISDLFYCIY